jgi:hypothetical protein
MTAEYHDQIYAKKSYYQGNPITQFRFNKEKIWR